MPVSNSPFSSHLLTYESLVGGGWASTSFFVDPKTGVAVVFGMQVAPIIGDSTHKKFLSVLEKEVYMALGVAV